MLKNLIQLINFDTNHQKFNEYENIVKLSIYIHRGTLYDYQGVFGLEGG